MGYSKLHNIEYKILFRRGLATNINVVNTKISAIEGEPHWTTDTNRFYIYDGTQNLGVAMLDTNDDLTITPIADSTETLLVNDKDGNGLFTVDTTNDRVGVGVTDPDTKLEILHAGNQLKLSFDATDNAIFAVNTDGELIILPSARTLYLGDGTAGDGTFGFYGNTSVYTLIHDDSEGDLKLSANDVTNYTNFADDGRMTMAGTARYWIGFEIDNTGFKEPTSQTATKVNRGLGTAYAYADGSTEHIHATMRITGRWDDTENIEVILIWETPTTSADCYWDVKYQIKGNDEDMTDVTTTSCAEHVKESSATANGLIHSTFTIPTAAFDAGDKILSLEIYRLGAEVTDTLGAIAYLHKMIVRGIANNLGGVVS